MGSSGGEPTAPRSDDSWLVTPTPTRHRRLWWGVTLVLVGTVWLLLALEVDVAWDLVLPTGLVVIGVLVLLVGRRARDGLINLGVWVGLAALLVTFVPGSISLTAGSQELRLTDPGELADERGLGAGRLTVDLRDLQLEPGTTRFAAGVTFGELVVLTPADVTVAGEGHVAIGEVSGFGRSDGGVARRTTWDEAGADASSTLELELGVGFGRIEVRR